MRRNREVLPVTQTQVEVAWAGNGGLHRTDVIGRAPHAADTVQLAVVRVDPGRVVRDVRWDERCIAQRVVADLVLGMSREIEDVELVERQDSEAQRHHVRDEEPKKHHVQPERTLGYLANQRSLRVFDRSVVHRVILIS